MSESNPITPGGAVPPKPPEAAKVQPKKETVRISLPPKPTSSPTIKLPTLPAGGPAAPSAPPAAAAAPAAGAPSSAAPPAPRPPTAGAPGLQTAAAAQAAQTNRPPTNTGAPVPRPPGAATGPARPVASASSVRKVSGLDVGLGIAAAVVGLGAVVCLALLLNIK